MGLRIVISTAVISEEKERIKAKLYELGKKHLIICDEIYDCNEHGAFYDIVPKQEIIDKHISNADWFICLVPIFFVGNVTCQELKYILELKNEVITLGRLRRKWGTTAPNQLNAFYRYLCEHEKKDVLEVIAQIMRFYELRPNYNNPINYTKEVSFDDVINLLILHNGNEEYWRGLSAKMNVNKQKGG